MPNIEFLIEFLDLIVSGFSEVWHYIETPIADLFAENIPLFGLAMPFLPDAIKTLSILRLSIAAVVFYLVLQLWKWFKSLFPLLS